MPTYKAPVSDTLFLLTDVFDFQRYSNLPRFAEGTPWWRVKTLLMGGRRAHALYLLGDDRIHLFPARVGVFGWGASAGVEF